MFASAFCCHTVVASFVECGVFGRSSQLSSGGVQSRTGYNQAGASQYGNYNYNTNVNSNSNIGNRRNSYVNQIDQPQTGTTNKNFPRTSSGLSAWGLITIIMLIIVIGMGGYYGIICYPLICKEERNYDIMDAASTTASANTPTRSGDFEKPGNYSSRSTTPSVIINT
ncbi:uncharacterized protein LOC129565517 isoform X2 [Sitodiplosis mosellana]|uniref:uncharacterized protein LOC129565517 isoform X2 n=1 Tax=Sitodiplosis mosellana TaxID=263140 RepID=UPI0024447A34|nr:uncharacterized protein LOC129565517 isoform X2 [Sitodiplosis mosellana]